MAYTIDQTEVLNLLHNQMGHRVPPGGTDDDLKHYIQAAFDYCWRYYKWGWAMKTTTTAADGVLPDDFDLDGYYSIADNYNVTWDAATKKLVLDPAGAETLTYQIAPPTLGTAPFPSAIVVAEGALVFAKLGENPTRADVTQEWDLFHSLLDRLVGRADAQRPRRPTNRHDVAGTHTGQV